MTKSQGDEWITLKMHENNNSIERGINHEGSGWGTSVIMRLPSFECFLFFFQQK